MKNLTVLCAVWSPSKSQNKYTLAISKIRYYTTNKYRNFCNSMTNITFRKLKLRKIPCDEKNERHLYLNQHLKGGSLLTNLWNRCIYITLQKRRFSDKIKIYGFWADILHWIQNYSFGILIHNDFRARIIMIVNKGNVPNHLR